MTFATIVCKKCSIVFTTITKGEQTMKLVIEIPEEFVEHFNNDKFKDSLERIKVNIEHQEWSIAGLYEIELLEMLKNAFNDAIRR